MPISYLSLKKKKQTYFLTKILPVICIFKSSLGVLTWYHTWNYEVICQEKLICIQFVCLLFFLSGDIYKAADNSNVWDHVRLKFLPKQYFAVEKLNLKKRDFYQHCYNLCHFGQAKRGISLSLYFAFVLPERMELPFTFSWNFLLLLWTVNSCSLPFYY